jgi:hypothetical protein
LELAKRPRVNEDHEEEKGEEKKKKKKRWTNIKVNTFTILKRNEQQFQTKNEPLNFS